MRSRSDLSAALVALGSAVLSGCVTGPSACTLSVEPGVVVTIRDSATGEPLAGRAVGDVVQGAYRDSLRAYGSQGSPPVMISRAGADERPGVYTVTVEVAGYQPWRREDVWVRAGACHVRTVQLEAQLQPSPGPAAI